MNPPTTPSREWGFFSWHYNCATSCVYRSISKTMPMKYSHKQKRERNLEGGHLIHLERKTSQQTLIKESQHWARGYEALWFQHRGKKRWIMQKKSEYLPVSSCTCHSNRARDKDTVPVPRAFIPHSKPSGISHVSTKRLVLSSVR